MLLTYRASFRDWDFDKLEAIPLCTGSPCYDGILDQLRCHIQPFKANVIAIVRIVDAIVVQIDDLGAG